MMDSGIALGLALVALLAGVAIGIAAGFDIRATAVHRLCERHCPGEFVVTDGDCYCVEAPK